MRLVVKTFKVDNGDSTFSINQRILFCEVDIQRCGFTIDKYRHDDLPRYVIRCGFFKVNCGLDHNWIDVENENQDKEQ